MKICENVNISTLTTMRLGGAATMVVEVENTEEVLAAFEMAEKRGLPVWVMGAGSNTIGHDEGFEGVIMINKIRGRTLEAVGEGAILTAGGGEIWDDVVAEACAAGYSGIEAMSKIPGTAGAAPVQNIGAYGQDIAQVLESVLVFDSFLQELKEIRAEEMNFGYRRSILNTGDMAGRYCVLEIKIRLNRGELRPPFYTSLQRYVEENQVTDFSPMSIRRMVSCIRAEKLPDPKVMANAGSFFKNVYLTDAEADEAEARGIRLWRHEAPHLPSARVHKVNSGWLIEQAGLKGKEFFGFRISEKAALILINERATKYAELAKARTEIIRIVKEKFGYTMEQEPVELKR